MVEETGVPRENHRPTANHLQPLSHIVVSSTHHHERDSFMVDHNLCFEEIAVKLAEISILWGGFLCANFRIAFLISFECFKWTL